ncbi:hypothetical protein D3C78_1405590 [compost metagenome]
MELATQSLQPVRTRAEHAIGEGIGKVHMQTGQPLIGQSSGQAIEQTPGIRRLARQQPCTAHRGKGHGRQQLGVIGNPRALARLGPGPVEDVLAARMALHVGRHGRQQLALGIAQQTMGRLPAAATTDTAALFQGSKKGMAQERLPAGQQPIPVMGGNQGE